MRRVGLFLGPALLLLLLLSCSSTKAFRTEPYLTAFGQEHHLVVTLDLGPGNPLISDLSGTLAENELFKRAERLSLSLYDPLESTLTSESTIYPDLSTYRFFGGIEGKFPKFLTNTLLLWDPLWEKIETEHTHYFKHRLNGLSAAVATSGLLLFASDDYLEAYNTTYAHRQPNLSLSEAQRLQEALFGFYVRSPQAMLDLGIDLPATVLMQIDSILLVIKEHYLLSGTIVMKHQRSANALSILLRNAYITERRRNNLPFTLKPDMVITDSERVEISDMDLTAAQSKAFIEMFGSLFVATGGVIQHANL